MIRVSRSTFGDAAVSRGDLIEVKNGRSDVAVAEVSEMRVLLRTAIKQDCSWGREHD